MKLRLVQDRIVRALKGVEAIAEQGIEAIAEDRGDVAKALQTALGRQRIALLVRTPGFTATSSASKVMVGKARVSVEAVENVMVNRASDCLTAQDLAEIAAWELNMLPLDGVGVLAFKSMDSALEDQKLLVYTVEFEVQTTLSDPLA